MKASLQKITMFAGSLLVATFLSVANGVAAAPPASGNFQVVDGVAIYLGVVPAQIVRGHPSGHSESAMHGGVPDRGGNHVVVALFDNATGQRIVNAQVSASVGELGLGSDRKALEPMKIADTISYGNYFSMPAKGEYLIKLSIFLPDSNRRVEANFQYETQGR